jgi:hypothetical protein
LTTQIGFVTSGCTVASVTMIVGAVDRRGNKVEPVGGACGRRDSLRGFHCLCRALLGSAWIMWP